MIVLKPEDRKNSSKSYKLPSNIKKIPCNRTTQGKKKQKVPWSLVITIISLILSITFMFVSTTLLKGVSTYIAFLIVLVIIFIGVIFDMIGVAVTAASESPFHAMASKKYMGAREAIGLIRHANRVSSFCNDVVGDICGVVSGAAGLSIIVRLFSGTSQYPLWEIVIASIIASLTVGGKAIGKTFAMHNSNDIVYKVGIALAFLGLGGIVSNGRK